MLTAATLFLFHFDVRFLTALAAIFTAVLCLSIRCFSSSSDFPFCRNSAPLNSTQNDVEVSDDEDASALNSSQIRRSSRISTKREIARARETSDVQTEDSSEDSSESSEESDVIEKKKSSSISKLIF